MRTKPTGAYPCKVCGADRGPGQPDGYPDDHLCLRCSTPSPKTSGRSLACLGLVVAVSGCASTLLSDDRLRSTTAGTLGQPPASVVITDRRDDGLTNTFYTAHTRRGVFACTINGGNVLTAGMVNPPVCNRL